MEMTVEQRRALAVARARRRRAEADVDAKGKDSWIDVGKQFGDRFNRGLYSMVNAPTALANAGAAAIGSDFRFKRPLEAAIPSADAALMDVPEPNSAAGRVFGYIGEFAGANALPGMGLISAAPRIAAATQASNSLVGQSVNRMASGIAAAPGTAAAGEALASVGSGLGASMAEGQGANAEYLASIAGGFAAPMALALSPANLARKGYNAARSRFSPEEIGRQQRNQIVDGIRSEMTPEGEEAISATLAIQKDAPGYRPSVAEATENPSFIATQREFESNLSGGDLNRAVQRYRSNEGAIDQAIQQHSPQTPLTLDGAFRFAGQRIAGINRKIDRETTRLDAMEARTGATLQANQRQRELGATVREELIARRANIKDDMSITARDMGLNDPSARFPFDSVRQQLIKSVEPRSQLV